MADGVDESVAAMNGKEATTGRDRATSDELGRQGAKLDKLEERISAFMDRFESALEPDDMFSGEYPPAAMPAVAPASVPAARPAIMPDEQVYVPSLGAYVPLSRLGVTPAAEPPAGEPGYNPAELQRSEREVYDTLAFHNRDTAPAELHKAARAIINKAVEVGGDVSAAFDSYIGSNELVANANIGLARQRAEAAGLQIADIAADTSGTTDTATIASDTVAASAAGPSSDSASLAAGASETPAQLPPEVDTATDANARADKMIEAAEESVYG